jgi:hypothetical protein
MGASDVPRTREIGLFHSWDRSLHVALPPAAAQEAVSAGWAEVLPVACAGLAAANLIMVYGPRDEGEVNGHFEFILAAYRRGWPP